MDSLDSNRMPFIIHLPGTSEELHWLEELGDRIYGKGKGPRWKPYNSPLISKEDLEKGGTIDLTKTDLEKGKFTFAVPSKKPIKYIKK